MKKLLLSFLFILSVVVVMSQSPRQFVLAEDFTSTLCTYCPGCAMGMDDLLANGKLVAVVESHSNYGNSDPYKNTYSLARNAMYGVQAYPTAGFDATKMYCGGNHTSSMYSSYVPLYNYCMGISSPVTMSMVVTNSGLDYTAVITLTKTDNITTTSNILYFFVTQSHISYNWEGQTHLEFVNRLMVPDANGTAIDFSSGNVQTVTLNYTMDASWPLADCEFVAAFQDKDAGQGNQTGTTGGYPIKAFKVYQAIKRGAIDLTVDFTASQTAVAKDATVTFTNNTNGGYIGTPETYAWSFPGGTPSTSTDKNPVIVYSDCGTHDVMLIVNRGGQIDTTLKTNYISVGTIVNVVAIPNDTASYNQPITLDATTPGATYLWAPGGATTPSITIDPAVVGYGAHMYAVTVNTPDGCSQYIISHIFFYDNVGFAQNNKDLSTTLYPNPNTGNFTLEMNSLVPQNIDVSISNSLGMKVYSENGISFSGKLVKPINLNNIPSGIYFMSVKNSGKTIVQKFLVK
jgi:PKD repeat protein